MGCTQAHSNLQYRAYNLHSAYLDIIGQLKICIENLEAAFNDTKFSCNLKNFSDYLQKKLAKVQNENLLKQIYTVLNEIKSLRSRLNVLFEINEQLDSEISFILKKKKSSSWQELEENITITRNSAIILYQFLSIPDICFEDAKTLILSNNYLC
ncbi:hypothetical protein ABPG74_019015 [Tetrahymena malaccensis]